MKNFSSMLALSVVAFGSPLHAQPVEEAVETMEEARDAAAEAVSDRTRSPSLANYGFIKQVDYPIAAWQADETGRVGYSVEVSSEGNPLNCEITDGVDLAILAAATCPLVMERAEFRPATNEDGENVAATYEGSYNWRKREAEMPQMSVTFQYLHDELGVSKDCKFLKMENIPEEMRRDIERDKARGKLCPGPAGKQGVPYRDENGVPIAKLVTVDFNVTLADPEAASPE